MVVRWCAVNNAARAKDERYLWCTRLVETPRGMLTIELSYVANAVMAVDALEAEMTLFNSDGWNFERRGWMKPPNSEGLPELISEWTGLPAASAEAVVAETLAHWKASAAYEWDIQIGRWTGRLVAGIATFILAFLGLLAWTIVSAVS